MTEREAKALRRRLANYRQAYAYEEYMPIPIWTDEEALRYLVHEGRDEEEATDVVSKWRALAADHDYNGPVLWRVQPGFVVSPGEPTHGPCWRSGRRYRPLLGPIHPRILEPYSALGRWDKTVGGVAFWIPKALTASLGHKVASQRKMLELVRTKYQLPEGHLSSFGELPVVAALMLAYKLLFDEAIEPAFRGIARVEQPTRYDESAWYGLGWEYNCSSLGLTVRYTGSAEKGRDVYCFPLTFEPYRWR